MHPVLLIAVGIAAGVLGWRTAGKAWRIAALAVVAVIASVVLGHFHL